MPYVQDVEFIDPLGGMEVYAMATQGQTSVGLGRA